VGKDIELYAPTGYWLLTPAEKAVICNGAGPKGYGWLVPDTLWGLSIKEAANIHDYMYSKEYKPWSNETKKEADRVFLNNMIRLINNASKLLRWLRLRRAQTYYEAVSHFGGPCYWHGKNMPSTLSKTA
jgi:hypothetical protein